MNSTELVTSIKKVLQDHKNALNRASYKLRKEKQINKIINKQIKTQVPVPVDQPLKRTNAIKHKPAGKVLKEPVSKPLKMVRRLEETKTI